MQSLKEKYRPRSLADVIGQPCVGQLRHFAADPYPCCILLEGPTGCGKSATAKALANDLGCYGHPLFEACYVLCAANFDSDTARHYFYSPDTPFKYCAPGKGFHVLIVEELEAMHPTLQVLAKDALSEDRLPRNVIVVATSNGVAKLPAAVRHRFAGHHYVFSAGPSFAEAINEWLPSVWEAEVGPGVDMPYAWETLGWDSEEFSARLALDRLDKYVQLERRQAVTL